MTYFYLILAACAPVVVLLWYIYRADKAQPEPVSWLLRAFVYGVFALVVSLVFTMGVQWLIKTPVQLTPQSTIAQIWEYAFVWAAVPEESAKLLLLWLLLRKNPYFDEHLDGIVYAVCVGLGFATVENIIYLFQGLSNGSWVSVGISRALFAVPGHFLYAVMMGYYYSLYYFGLKKKWYTLLMIWLVPVLIHGVYDGIVFSMDIDEIYAAIGLIVFLCFFGTIQHVGRRRIETLKPDTQIEK